MTDTITVVGNIATNPEQRMAGTLPLTSFRIASTERRPDAQGTWVDAHTNYYTVSAFRTLGEHAFLSLRRGDRVVVSGRLRLKEWTNADGSKGRGVDIDADALGHDLRFGTTVFQRAGRSEPSADTTGTAAGSGWEPAEGWRAPEVPPGEDSVGPGAEDRLSDRGDEPAAEEGADRVLALAGADTPF